MQLSLMILASCLICCRSLLTVDWSIYSSRAISSWFGSLLTMNTSIEFYNQLIILRFVYTAYEVNGPRFAHAILTTNELLSMLPADHRWKSHLIFAICIISIISSYLSTIYERSLRILCDWYNLNNHNQICGKPTFAKMIRK